jgi:hypothetical protein
MRRLALQGTAVVVAGALGLLAWAWSEVAVGFGVLGLAMGFGLLSLARRFPPPVRSQRLVAAICVFAGSVAVAALLPSTRVPCDCPLPADAVRGCACPIDHHWSLRIATIAAGVLAAGLLVRRSRQRRWVGSATPGAAP